VSYAVDVPASYDGDTRRYPVVYALHGLFESPGFWEGRGLSDALARLRARGGFADFIVVAVEGGNSFYVNGPAGRHEDVVTRDAIAFVEKTFRVVPGREGRGLLGVSMGGYAALRIALSEPDRFSVVVTHSAMLLTKPPTAADGAGRFQMAAMQRVFGDPIDPQRWAAADPLALAETADPKRVPALSLDCGAQDRYGLAAGHRELERRLRARGVEARVETPPGDHGYEYVRTVFAKGMAFLGERLADR
jgi:S-formylglutathione hydrolase FrmB